MRVVWAERSIRARAPGLVVEDDQAPIGETIDAIDRSPDAERPVVRNAEQCVEAVRGGDRLRRRHRAPCNIVEQDATEIVRDPASVTGPKQSTARLPSLGEPGTHLVDDL